MGELEQKINSLSKRLNQLNHTASEQVGGLISVWQGVVDIEVKIMPIHKTRPTRQNRMLSRFRRGFNHSGQLLEDLSHHTKK